MHLNIPPHDESLVQSYMRNLKWGLIGVFGPELVVFAAWRQYNSAEELKAEVNRQINVMGILPSQTEKVDGLSKVNSRCWLMLVVKEAHYPLGRNFGKPA
jgi:hypothetical protein